MQRFDEEYSLTDKIQFVLLVIATAIAFMLAFYFMPKKGDVVRIDCSISEISPDFTPEMREACRQLRAKKP